MDIIDIFMGKTNDDIIQNYHNTLKAYKKFIESVEHGIESHRKAYFELSKEEEDEEIKKYFMINGLEYMFDVRQIAYYSIITSLMSLLEDGLSILAEVHQTANNYSIKSKDMSGRGIERSINYLKKVCGIKTIKEDEDWEYIRVVRDIRNKIVHANGKISRDEKKLIERIEKYGFNVEDGRIWLDDLDINEAYDRIYAFSKRFIQYSCKMESS